MELSKKCCGIQIDKTTILVYTPDDSLKDIQNSLPPRFYRLRKVNIILGKYFICSCGWCIRMKMPCRHILFITQKYLPEMFGLRWMNLYQYCFSRPGYEDLTTLYRKIEEKEFKRSELIQSAILFSEFHQCNKTFPNLLHNTTEKQCVELKLLFEADKKELIIIRGFDIKEQLDKSVINSTQLDSTLNITLSQDSEVLFHNDYEFITSLQEEQMASQKQIMTKVDNETEIGILKIREVIKVVEDDSNLKSEFRKEIDNLYDKYTALARKSKNRP